MAKKEQEFLSQRQNAVPCPVCDYQAEAADKLAMEYFDRSEAYDRKVCSELAVKVGNKLGIAVPANAKEYAKSSRHAAGIRQELVSRLKRKFELENREAWPLLLAAIERNKPLWEKEYVAGKRPER